MGSNLCTLCIRGGGKMIKRLLRSAINTVSPINCYTCRWGYEQKGRLMPLCAAGASSYQLDCMKANHSHWEPIQEASE